MLNPRKRNPLSNLRPALLSSPQHRTGERPSRGESPSPEPIPEQGDTHEDKASVESTEATTDTSPQPIPEPETPSKAEVLPPDQPEVKDASNANAEEAPQQEAPQQEAPQQEAPQQEAPQQEAPQQEAPNQPPAAPEAETTPPPQPAQQPQTHTTPDTEGSRRLSHAPIGFSRLSRGGIDWKLQTLIQIRSAMYLPLLRKIRSQMAEYGQPSTLEDVEIVIKPEHESLFRKQATQPTRR